MRKISRRKGPWYWLWLAAIAVASFFVGWNLGKLIRRGLAALAIPEIAGFIIELILVIPISFAWSRLVEWADNKLFGWDFMVFGSTTPSEERQPEQAA